MNQFKNIADLNKKVKAFFKVTGQDGNNCLNITSNGIKKTYYYKKHFDKWLMDCINARINRNEPQKRGRKDTEEFRTHLKSITYRLQKNVIVRESEVNWLLNKEPKIKAKIVHRLYTNDDF